MPNLPEHPINPVVHKVASAHHEEKPKDEISHEADDHDAKPKVEVPDHAVHKTMDEHTALKAALHHTPKTMDDKTALKAVLHHHPHHVK